MTKILSRDPVCHWMCPLCGKTFLNQTDTLIHITETHPTVDNLAVVVAEEYSSRFSGNPLWLTVENLTTGDQLVYKLHSFADVPKGD